MCHFRLSLLWASRYSLRLASPTNKFRYGTVRRRQVGLQLLRSPPFVIFALILKPFSKGCSSDKGIYPGKRITKNLYNISWIILRILIPSSNHVAYISKKPAQDMERVKLAGVILVNNNLNRVNYKRSAGTLLTRSVCCVIKEHGFKNT